MPTRMTPPMNERRGRDGRAAGPGGTRHAVLSGLRRRHAGSSARRDRVRVRARPPGVGRRHDTRSVCPSRGRATVAEVRARMPAMAWFRPSLALAAAPADAALVASAVLGPGRSPPTARPRPSRRRSARSCSAGPSSRCRRWPSLLALGLWLWAVRRVDRRIRRTPCRVVDRWRSAWRCWPSPSRCCRASSATTRRCSRSTWSSTSC